MHLKLIEVIGCFFYFWMCAALTEPGEKWLVMRDQNTYKRLKLKLYCCPFTQKNISKAWSLWTTGIVVGKLRIMWLSFVAVHPVTSFLKPVQNKQLARDTLFVAGMLSSSQDAFHGFPPNKIFHAMCVKSAFSIMKCRRQSVKTLTEWILTPGIFLAWEKSYVVYTHIYSRNYINRGRRAMQMLPIQSVLLHCPHTLTQLCIYILIGTVC